MDDIRIIPSDWMGPLNLPSVFGCKSAALEVDVGCGKGRFLLARAGRHPDISYLGIDSLLLRILRVEREVRRQSLSNVRLLYIEACYAVSYLLPPRSVMTYYIFFPDPWPKRRQHRRRLFDEGFLNALDKTLIPAGSVHIATDHQDYLAAIRKIFRKDARFESIPPFEPSAEEHTDFERLFLGQHKPIGRCSFRRNPISRGH